MLAGTSFLRHSLSGIMEASLGYPAFLVITFQYFLDYHYTLYLDLSFMLSCILHYYASLDLGPKSTAKLTQHPFFEIGTLHVYHGMLRAVLDSRL
jgi:hypothetical protein